MLERYYGGNDPEYWAALNLGNDLTEQHIARLLDGKSTVCDSESSGRERKQMSTDAATNIRFEAAVPQFTVPDLIQTAEYYRDVLGFQIAGYWDGECVSLAPETPPVFAIVWRDQIQVFFSRAHRSDVRTGRADGACDAYFRVTGIDALAEELRARGAVIIDGPEDRVYQQRELAISDCNDLVRASGRP